MGKCSLGLPSLNKDFIIIIICVCVLIERASLSSNLIIQGHIQGQHLNVYRQRCLWKVCMYMKLGHGPEGATGLAINQRQMIEGAPSFAICGVLSADVH